jgi:hypothetical protein
MSRLRSLLSWFLPGYRAQRRAYEKGLAKAQQEIAHRKRAGYVDGYTQGELAGSAVGRTCGESVGRAIGLKEGRAKAYHEYMDSVGLAAQNTPETWTVPNYQLNMGPHANIYDEGDAYCVRLLVGGKRVEEWFFYLPGGDPYVADGRVENLVAALKFRRGLLATSGNLPMWCLDYFDVRYNNDIGRYSYMDNAVRRSVCLEMALDFHRWLLSDDSETAWRLLTQETPPFLGEDPAVRCPAADRAVFDWLLPWDEHEADWLMAILKHFGLEGRTTRDLLLLSAEDLDDVDGVGPKRIKKLRAQLAVRGLALWGDPPPTVGSPDRQREGRSIVLD